MDLSVREAARLLSVFEASVYRWIKDGSLPAYRVGNQYRLNRVELQEWAATRGHRVSPVIFASNGASGSVTEALGRGGIHRGVGGTTRAEVLEMVTRLPEVPETDRELLHDLVLASESPAPPYLCIGRGIALPHPRAPLVSTVREPRLMLCFLESSVDFGAFDGEPVRTLFLLLSPSVHAHLHLLARLAYALHDDVLRQVLGPKQTAEAILDRIGIVERGGAQP
ncbi:MAG: PTS sugar transporter subunit IIA [Deltaproteobacteria bacterium]|nr:PTS sugar transporter subunit IIA [Deltaproteobacteria bacterium]